MNYKKFDLLNIRLIELLEEREELFVAQRPIISNKTGETEALKAKYPDIDEAIKVNKMNTESVLRELDELWEQDQRRVINSYKQDELNIGNTEV